MNDRIHQGHFARKRFGQNFLHDPFIIDQIVLAIDPQPGQEIIEIGPGLGALTQLIADKMDHMTVIEIDHDLAERLKKHPTLSKKLLIHQQDVLQFDFAQLQHNSQQSLRIVGNLPYNISTPLLFHLFRYNSYIQDMHFMLQKEVVKRLVSTPNHKSYGRLSVMAQYYCNIIPILDVPPSAFTPSPKVDSVMVKLVPHPTPPYVLHDIELLNRVTTLAFSQRRKTIRNSLKNLFTTDVFKQFGLHETMRAENITLEQYCQLANLLVTNASTTNKQPAS